MKTITVDLQKTLNSKGVELPENVLKILSGCKSFSIFNTTDELNAASTNGIENNAFEVKYDIPVLQVPCFFLFSF